MVRKRGERGEAESRILLLVAAVGLVGAVVGAAIGGAFAYATSKSDQTSTSNRDTEATLESRAATLVSSVNQLAILATNAKDGDNDQQLQSMLTQIDSETVVLQLGTQKQAVQQAAANLWNTANGMLAIVSFEGNDPAGMRDAAEAVGKLANAINPSLHLRISDQGGGAFGGQIAG